MKYIIINDISNLLKKHCKLLLFTICIFSFYAFYIKNYVIESNNFLYYIGLIFDKKYIALISLFIFNYVICIYLNCSIYINGLRVGYDYLFTRMKFNDWNYYKIVSIFIITFIIKIIQTIIYIIFFGIDINIIDIIQLIMHSLIIINISLSIIQTYIFQKSYNIYFSIIIYILFILFIFNFSYDFNWKYLIINICILLINLKIFKNQKSCNIKIMIGG